jgi:hypothetical protein
VARLRRSALRLLVVIVVLGCAGYLASRWLAPPNVGEPYDVVAFTSFTLPDERNAFTYYRKAVDRYVNDEAARASGPALKYQDFIDSVEAAEKGGWEHALPAVRRWVALNEPALKDFERGAECADSLAIPLAEVSKAAELSFEWGKLRACSQAECLKGIRLTAEGRPAEAWNCFRSVLRASRHLAMHARRIEALFGNALAHQATDGGVHWSAQKSVGKELLRKALCDVQSAEELPARASDSIKVEYLALREVGTRGVVFGTPLPSWVRATGYPAQVARTARLVVANLLTQADRPRFRRTPLHPGSLGLFELDPTETSDPRLRPPAEIEAFAATKIESLVTTFHWLGVDADAQTVLLLESVDPQLQSGNLWEAYLWHDLAETYRDGLLLALALQLHYREHGELPASLDKLVKNGYLKSIPADPFGKGEAFHYRRELASHSGAVLWSVYRDGVDDGGADLHFGKGDWAIHVRVPGTSDASAK